MSAASISSISKDPVTVNKDLASRGYPITVAKRVEISGMTLRFNQEGISQILVLPPDHAASVKSHQRNLQAQLLETIITMPKELTNLIAQYACVFFPSIPSTLLDYPLIQSCVLKMTKNLAFSTNPCSIPATTVMVICKPDENLVTPEYKNSSQLNLYYQHLHEKSFFPVLNKTTEITSEEHFPDHALKAIVYSPMSLNEDFRSLDIGDYDVSDAMLDHPLGGFSSQLVFFQSGNASSQTQKPESHLLHLIFYKLKDEETFDAPTLCEQMSHKMVKYVTANKKFAEIHQAAEIQKAQTAQTAATAVSSGTMTAATALL